MFKEFLSDAWVEKRYARSGSRFGDAVSYLYMGECVGFEGLLTTWESWEREYSRRGFRTLSVDALIDHGGYGIELQGLGQQRDAGEEPVLHAARYRELYLGKVEPVIDITALMQPGQDPASGMQTATYVLPTTRQAADTEEPS